MLSKEQMIDIAEKFLAAGETEVELVLVLPDVIEKSYGMIFSYTSKDFLETRKFEDALIGNPPFLVNNENGQIIIFGTDESLVDYLEAYESGIWVPDTIDDFMVE